MLMPSSTINNIPTDARQKQSEIPVEERCSACNGLGWVCWKHSYPSNQYCECLLCKGTGRKSKQAPV